ncbi:DUF4142 domain-containing protein [Streptomyces sp. LP05-1]|uniref:DUF4142 domain-containing protein n=1 Tax=Streptomyces pyxinae TaxID=2970734 RepID=A0ABT2CEF2_9ACTN|nr:DUF4142 domain-containing protein [Streptomyces sp. LP05-1]MCS0635492.1 DUF4142 domain-containing protein [Streptomyces sp. LP05-1]
MRWINGSVLIIAALVATIGALAFPVWSYADRSGTGQANLDAATVATQWGPLSATDRDFLVKVRLAGLWELPAGQQAIERAPSKAIRDAGDHLVVGHTDLDQRVRDVSARLGVELPNQPNEQQQGWLRELSAASGQEYERKFANLLRNAHGKVFALVAQVRHTTRNSLVRQLATDANQTVLDHITMLEQTGLVDFDALANEAAGAATASPTGPPPPGGGLPPAPSPAVPSGDDQSFTSRPSTQPGPPTAVNTDRPPAGGHGEGGTAP